MGMLVEGDMDGFTEEPGEYTGEGSPGVGTFTLEIDLPAACSSCWRADWDETEYIKTNNSISVDNIDFPFLIMFI